jgi:hypothetical protein
VLSGLDMSALVEGSPVFYPRGASSNYWAQILHADHYLVFHDNHDDDDTDDNDDDVHRSDSHMDGYPFVLMHSLIHCWLPIAHKL